MTNKFANRVLNEGYVYTKNFKYVAGKHVQYPNGEQITVIWAVNRNNRYDVRIAKIFHENY